MDYDPTKVNIGIIKRTILNGNIATMMVNRVTTVSIIKAVVDHSHQIRRSGREDDILNVANKIEIRADVDDVNSPII